MSRARCWAYSILLALLVWGIGIISTVVAINTVQRDEYYALIAIPPVIAVFLIGVWAADHWWTRGSLLIAVPPAVVVLVLMCLFNMTWDDDRTRDGDGIATVVLLFLVIINALGAVAAAVAAVVVAALGVWIGEEVR